jgi:succinate-semialdehyde dehydrogenase/glutarate-semialdehyde dehydrogenase
MAGMAASELGRRHGEHGILKYTEPQTIAIERGLPVGPPPWIAQTITHAS